MITVLLVHADPAVRQHLASALASDPEITIVGSVGTAAEGYQLGASHMPDVAVLSPSLTDASRFEVVRQFRRRLPYVSVMAVLSGLSDDDLFAAIRAGTSAYCLPDIAAVEVITLVKRLASGEYLLSDVVSGRPGVGERVLDQFRHADPYVEREQPIFNPLTETERHVLFLVGQGMSNAEIAAELGASRQSVKNQVTAILRKLSVNDRTQALLDALRDDDDSSAAGMPARPRPPRPSSDGHAAQPPGAEQAAD